MPESSRPVSLAPSWWQRLLFREIDIAWLAVLRVFFGLIMFWEVFRFFKNGYIERYWVNPDFHFTYPGFDWIVVPDGNGMYLLFGLLGLAAAGITLGFLYRICATVFCLGYSYAFFSEQAVYQNHFYLICLVSFLMIFVPANGAMSLDVLSKRRKPLMKIPAWPKVLICAQVGIVYFYGGIAKLNGDWLQGEPMRMWLADRGDYPLIGSFLTTEFAAYFYSYGGILFDLAIPFLLLYKRTRIWALLSVVAFHFNNSMLFSIGVFPVLGTALSTAFLAPDWPRRIFAARCFPSWGTPTLQQFPTRRAGQFAVAAFVGFWVLSQCLIPLRHHFIPGNVAWTEEGHRFSWRMKLRSKDTKTHFMVQDLETGRGQLLEPDAIMTGFQEDRFGGHPDMILQACKRVREVEEARTGKKVSVYAYVEVSLNGRPYHQLINPQVDLAAMPRQVGPKNWLMPMHRPLRGEQAVASHNGFED